MMNQKAYTSWATAAAGLLALTYGLDRCLEDTDDKAGWGISAVAGLLDRCPGRRSKTIAPDRRGRTAPVAFLVRLLIPGRSLRLD